MADALAAPGPTMRAALLHGQGDLRLEEVPRPHAGPGALLVRVHRCGVCGSDLRSFGRGPSARYMSPVILGHEFVGTVAEVGDGVGGFRVGDRVTAAPAIPCGACDACRRGEDNLCANLLDFGINIAGALAEHVLIPARSVAAGAVVRVPAAIPDAAAILGEPIGCCLRGLRRGRVGPGSTVLVLGDGPIGLTHALLARHLGAGRVLAAGISPARLEVVARAGFETLDVSIEDPVALLADRLGPPKADTVVAANPDPRAIETAMSVVRDGGTVVAFGGLAGDPHVTLDGNRVHYGEHTLVGSFNCTTAEFREAIELAGLIDTDLFDARTYPLDQIHAAFEAAGSRAVMKAVVTMEP